MKSLTSICLGVLIVFASFVLAPAQEAPRIIKGGVLNGKATSLPKPEYPAEAKKAHLSGSIYVDVVIDETGNVMSATASPLNGKVRTESEDEPPPPPGEMAMRQAAEDAALEARFSPTLLSGVPVKVSGKIVYNFVLDNDDTASVLAGGVLNGKATSLPMPAYPEPAKAVRAIGTVVVEVTIDENGDVISARAMSGHPLLRAASVDAAREAKFAPTRLSGQPVKVSGLITYNFVVPDEHKD